MSVIKSNKIFRTIITLFVAVFAAFAAILIFDFCRFRIKNMKCWYSEYQPMYYLARCNNPTGFTYEVDAIYYGLESGISEAIRNAQVIFVGTSKVQHTFSTQATSFYFANQNIRFYMLGFLHYRSGGFVLPILKRQRASPSVLIVNADPFFICNPPPKPARSCWEM